jgi:isopropylmalate/homocitrate/citramalate synthase
MDAQVKSVPPTDVLLDTTLRDGEQAPGVALTPDEKAEYVRRAEALGIRYIEVGFPQNVFDFEPCLAAVEAAKYSRIVAMALTTLAGVDSVVEVGAHEILFVVPSSASHLQHVYGKALDRLIADLQESIEYASHKGLLVNIGLEDAGQGDFSTLDSILNSLLPNGTRIDCVTIPDTRGQLLPAEVCSLITSIRERLHGLKCRIAFHAHNDLGLATANSLAALQMDPPVDALHVTTCGFGERAGNASLEQMAILLETKFGRKTLELSRLTDLTEYVEEIFLTPLSAHAPVVGSKVFLHESALHQKGMLRDSASYQYLDPVRLGGRSRMVLGKHSGKSLRQWIADRAECGEDSVCSLQRDLVTADKSEAKATFRRALQEIRQCSMVGKEEENAVSDLNSATKVIS